MQNPNRSNLPALLAFVAFIALFLTLGCGGGGGGTTTTGGTTGTVLQGRLLNSDTFAGVPSVRIRFYNTVGTQLSSVVTDANGRYSLAVGTIPSRLHILSGDFPNQFYVQYLYRTFWYLPRTATCRAELPTINANVVNNLGDILITPSYEPPPPPPSGCN